MPRTRGDLRRRKWIVEPRPRMLVCCEGEVTEPSYLNGLKVQLQIRLVHIEVVPGGSNPKTLVDHAVERKQQAERDARREKDDNLKYDEVWCVFDVDAHEYIPEAKQKAGANDIRLAISNPCFELWLLLHFRDQRQHIERHQTQSACREHMPAYDKEVPFGLLFPHYQSAVQRALQLDHWQDTRGCAGENPSTGVYQLTERITELSREEQLKKHRAGGR